MSDLLAYRMPITKIIEDNSVKDVRDLEVGRYNIPIFKVKAEKFKQEKFMQRHLDSNRTVTISRAKLIEKMKENRDSHRAIYEEAVGGFQAQLRETMKAVGARLVDSVEQGIVLDLKVIRKLTEPLSEIQAPTNYLQAYAEAIELFEWDERPSVELKVEEFRKYILDRWDWQSHFLRENRGYATSAVVRSRALGMDE